jgi:hypothetical protein
MPLGFGLGRTDDVAALIAKKQYAKAIEAIRDQLKSGRPNPRLRLQLADVLVLADRAKEAVAILLPLADEYAREGFAAKAISVLKKIQKLDPGRGDIEGRLASLIETKQREASVSLPLTTPSSSMPEIGIEEIGMAPPESGSLAVPVGATIDVPGGPEIGMEPPAGDFNAAASHAETGVPATPSDFALVPDEPAPPISEPPRAEAVVAPAPVEDLDLVAGEIEELPLDSMEPLIDGDDLDLESLESEAEGAEAGPGAVDDKFASELLSVIDEVFPSGVTESPTEPVEEPTTTSIVVSPLFKDLAVDEMVAVIQGLNLLTFQPRQIILRQGDPGDRLYMLASGRVRAFVKTADGKQKPLADLEEGAFFGEMSILTGKPRTATIVAVTECDLLELDRPTLDGIVARHPRVRTILEEFARARAGAHARAS